MKNVLSVVLYCSVTVSFDSNVSSILVDENEIHRPISIYVSKHNFLTCTMNLWESIYIYIYIVCIYTIVISHWIFSDEYRSWMPVWMWMILALLKMVGIDGIGFLYPSVIIHKMTIFPVNFIRTWFWQLKSSWYMLQF